MVGINAGDGVNFKTFSHSLTDTVIEVLNDTNMRDCNLKGQYVYQIDTAPIFDDQKLQRFHNWTCIPYLWFWKSLFPRQVYYVF